MGRLAFLYPGQGSQRVGMGRDLLETHPGLFWRYLHLADAVSGLPVSKTCLEGPIETLTQTEIAQPALFAVSLGLTDDLRSRGLRPDFVAGHSLGEYTAAVVAGALSAEEGMRLVCERGRLMAAIQADRPGAMGVVQGLPADVVATICAEASVFGLVVIANINSHEQLVVSGDVDAVERAVSLASQAGADKAVKLQVGAGFHTERMVPVRDALAMAMHHVQWRQLRTPVASIATGKLLTDSDKVKEALLEQIVRPVHWVACVTALVEAGCDTFLEVGSGRVLTGLTRMIYPDVDVFSVDCPSKADFWLRGHSQYCREDEFELAAGDAAHSQNALRGD